MKAMTVDDASVERARKAARDASLRAYAPYSGFKVGAAVLVPSGEIFTGCNVENASYGLTLCAERVAAAAAVAAGWRTFEVVAVHAEGPQLPVPCGACRQFLAEFGMKAMVVVSNGSESRALPLAELLPLPFGASCLPPTTRA